MPPRNPPKQRPLRATRNHQTLGLHPQIKKKQNQQKANQEDGQHNGTTMSPSQGIRMT